MSKKIVIYCRYSSDMQRADSCADQERGVRAGLARKGIDPADAVVLRDEAESGTKTARDGFQQLCEMVARGKVGVLAVDDQSRLTRADNAFAFVTDLVFAGEDIDTAVPGWELKVQVLQLHHGQTVRDLQHRVRRGQIGRVLDDGSAGDFPYGYESFYLDPDWAAQLARRGPKPKKGVRVCEDEARWVRQAFAWFVAGRSIGWVARELTKRKAPKGRRASTTGWHPQQVRRMLSKARTLPVELILPGKQHELPEPPKMATTSGPLLAALHECGRTAAKESGRFALSKVQFQGKAGRVVGTDGKVALLWHGFAFPFPDDGLVPALPVFGAKPLAAVKARGGTGTGC